MTSLTGYHYVLVQIQPRHPSRLLQMRSFRNRKLRTVFERHINLRIRNLDIQIQEAGPPQRHQPDFIVLLPLPLIPRIHPLLHPLDARLTPSEPSIIPQRARQNAQPPINHSPRRQRRKRFLEHSIDRLNQLSELSLADPLGQDLGIHVLQRRVQVARYQPVALYPDDPRRFVER